MIKACSFLPAATRMIRDMGLQHLLHGVTFECPVPPEAGISVVVRCTIEGAQLGGSEIDRVFSEAQSESRSLYYVEEELLRRIRPDVIFTQDVCAVCQIDSGCTAAAIAGLDPQPRLVSLTPRKLEEVFGSAMTVAQSLEREDAGYAYLDSLRARTDAILGTLCRNGMPVCKVLLLEWMDPVYHCGHWIPEQIAAAGGADLLGKPGGYSTVTSWDTIRSYNPEVIVLAPCGFDTARAAAELPALTKQPGWNDLQAVRNGQVFLADADLFTQPSAGTLVDGIELLAALFHPGLFSVPEHLQHKFTPIPPQP